MLALLDLLKERKIAVSAVDGALRVKAPKGAIDAEVDRLLKQHKHELVEFLVRRSAQSVADDGVALAPVTRGEASITSFPQQRLWFVDQLEGGSAQYNLGAALRLRGRLDTPALQRALDTIVERHEVLRTIYRADEDAALQVVQPFHPVGITTLDLSGDSGRETRVRELAAEEGAKSFDLARDLMLRVTLIRLADEEHVLLFTMHHIASDGWSMTVLVREFVTLYGVYTHGDANPLPPLPIQYADYAHWQRERLRGDGLVRQLDYWKARLDGIPQLHSLPLDKPRGARQNFIAGKHAQHFEAPLVDALQQLAREEGATLFMILQSAYALLLARWSGTNDVVMAVPTAGRTHAAIEPLIGFFINTLVFRNQFSRGDSFRDVLRRAKGHTLEAYANQQIPFEMLVDELKPERALSYNPLCQIKFVLQNYQSASQDPAAVTLPGLKIESVPGGVERIRFDLDLTASESPDGLHLSWSFKDELFDASTVERMAQSFRVLVEELISRPDTPVHELRLLDDAAQAAILAQSRGAADEANRDACVHRAFEAQAERTPHAVAVRWNGGAMTYRELNEQANRLAHYLLEQDVERGARVGLYVERSPEVLAGMLAILKAGAAYVPFEPGNTAERLRHVIANGGITCVLVQSRLSGKLPVKGLDVVLLDDAEWLGDYDATNPDIDVSPDDSAYVIYTSGSTGLPKGVEIRHGGLTDYLAFASGRYYASHLDGSLVVTSHGFDITVPSLYVPLLHGGSVTLTTPGEELTEFSEKLASDSEAFLLRMTPMHLTGALALLPTANRQPSTANHVFVIGGESFPATLARELQSRFPNAQIFNHYGPTETVVGCAIFDVTANLPRLTERIPIGKPMANTQLYVLNEALQLAPVGVPGELHIGGAGVAKGYVHQPELTDAKFIRFDDGRVYKSGDLVRWLPTGDLEFLGRVDDQIKIRGFRIELGEIESVLKAEPNVKDALVVTRGEGENKSLVAYVIADAAIEPALRGRLKQALPEYMIPGGWCFLEAFPLNANGKIDRKALPAIDRTAEAQHVAPATETETRLAEIWKDVLALHELPGVTASFFELGGHSLLATRVVSAVSQAFRKSMPVRTLFEHNTVRALAAHLDAQRETGHTSIPRVSRDETLPLSFGQQRLWFVDQLEPESAQYNMPIGLRLRGSLDRDALQRALDQLVARHEVLRTVYRDDAQVILPATPVVIAEHAATEEQEVQQLARAEAKKVFRLDRDLMLRVTLIRVLRAECCVLSHVHTAGCSALSTQHPAPAPQDHVLLFTMHHIASDAWSLGIVVREFVALYRGETLPPLPIQYADFAAWQRSAFEGETQLAYWKEHLADAPPVHSLPLDFPRSARQRFEGARVGHTIARLERLQELARAHNTSLFMVVQAAFALLIGRWSNETDVVMGTPVAGRNHRDAENLIGLFLNTLVLRTRISEEMDFHALIEQARETHLAAHQHGEVPFEAIVEALNPERSLVHAPVFQLLINMNNTAKSELSLPGLDVAPLQQEQSFDSKYDITLYLKETDAGLSCVWAYNSHLFRRDSIERMAAELDALIGRLLDNPSLPVLAHGWGSEWRTATAVPMQAELIHRRIEQNVSDSPAVIGERRALTYRELNAEANQLARHLRAIGIEEGDRVAVCSERNEARIVAVLAILKAGAVYVPLSQELPPKRLEYMARNARSKVLLTDSISDWSVDGIPSLLLDDPALLAACAQQSTANLDCSLTADSPAHIIYTSGSTGNPKGVLGTHGATVNRADWMLGEFPFAPGERASHITSMAFIRGIWELFTPLCAGVPLVLFDRDVVKDPSRFVPALHAHGVTRIVTAPSLMRALLDHDQRIETLKYWFVSGEALSVDIARRVDAAMPHTSIFNLYGSTEVLSDVLFTSVRGHEHTASVPLGRPIDNVAVTIADRQNNPVPDGVVGQIVVTGRCVALGYEGLEELSKRQFIDTPAGRGYRTGDLGRVLPCGNVEYLGRIDHQTKIRGYRIEPGEIEAQINALEGISSAAVVTRVVAGETRLFAYLVFEKDRCEIEGLGRVKQELKAILPEFMIPSAFTVLPELPLTANGKVNRKSLPEPDFTAAIAFVAPRTGTEAQLAAIWGEILKVEKVSVIADFFELGGHSLLATRAASAISQRTNKKVTVRTIFEHNTVESLAAWLDAQASSEYAPIPRVSRDEPLALSFAQQRLWFIDQLEGGSAQYNIPFALRLKGNLRIDALQHAFDEIVRRHEVIRSTYHLVDELGVQVIHDATPMEIERGIVSDPSGVQRLIREEASRPFDLAKDRMLRAKLLTISEDEHVLLFTMHHIASDGWSMGVLVKELVALYGGESLTPLPIQYADFAAWQRAKAQEGEQIAYWKRQLSGAPSVHSLPLDRPRPAQQQFAGRTLRTQISAETLAGLRRLAATSDATLFMVLQTAFSLLVSRWSGAGHVVVGTPVAGRTHKDTEELIGFFVNTLVLRNEIAHDAPFTELLRNGRRTVLDAFSNQDVPFEVLVEELEPERSLSHAPVYQIVFVLQNNERVSIELPGLQLSGLGEGPELAKVDLTLSATEGDHGLSLAWNYPVSLFDADTIERLAASFEVLLRAIVAAPETASGRLPVLTQEQQAQLIAGAGKSQELPPYRTLHALFEEQAAKNPEAIAVRCEDRQLTYAELNARANQLARELRDRGVGANVLVGICIERSLEMVVGLVAILKAGGAYVPLDPGYPKDRLTYMLENSGVRVVLTQGRLARELPIWSGQEVFALDEQWDAIAHHDTSNLGETSGLRDLAYMIYTSGSTGKPKGAMNEHRGICNRLYWMQDEYELAAGDRILQKTPFSFDVSVWEFFWPLITGTTIVVAKPEGHKDGEYLARLIQDEQITTVHFVPSMLSAFLRTPNVGRCTSLKRVICSGEALPPELVKEFFRHFDADRNASRRCELHNLYGPTEAAVDVTSWACTPENIGATVPIGRAIANTQMYVLDRDLKPVPHGVPGELFIGGVQVGRGYHERPELTAEKFIADPFRAEPDARLYRTGDLARCRPDGVLEFLGRLDDQVKIRGFRIELGEIQAQLLEQPQVREALVVARGEGSDKRLVAYVVPREQSDDLALIETLKTALRQQLPDYMVPSAFVVLESFPLNANGKIDRKALPEPDWQLGSTYVAPRNEAEETLAAIWAKLLKLQRVGVEDNFFAIGGDSILSIQAVSRANQAGIAITTRQLFEHQTVAGLVANAGRGVVLQTPQEPMTGSVSLLPIQREFLAGAHTNHFNQSILLQTPENFDARFLREVVAALYTRHDALRLTFHGDTAAHVDFTGAMLDAAAIVEEHPENLTDRCTHYQQSFDLSTGPLFKAVYFEPGRLLLIAHHVVVDGVSWRILLADIEQAFRQYEAGQAIALPPKTSSFQQWGEAMREYAHSETLAAEKTYWLSQYDVRVPALPVDRVAAERPTVATTRRTRVRLDAESTQALLQRCAPVYRTTINELLLSGIYLGMRRWTHASGLRLALEGHGREPLFEHLDTTQTVGWFTTVFPLTLQSRTDAVADVIKSVKEQYRALPNNGIGYGLLRHVTRSEATVAHAEAHPPQLVFNYLGQFDQTVNADTALKGAAESMGPRASLERVRPYQLGLNGLVANGVLEFALDYSELEYDDATMAALAQSLQDGLRAVVEHCTSIERGAYTPSDFPLADVSQSELDAWQSQYPSLTRLYRATAMQQGMLFHSMLDSGAYVTQFAPTFAGALDVPKFREAWRMVVARHDVFRTAFVGEGKRLHQLIVAAADMPWHEEDWRGLGEHEQRERFEEYRKADRVRGFDIAIPPLQRVALFRLGDERYQLLWSQHHMLLDGWCKAMLHKEVVATYMALVRGITPQLPAPPDFEHYMRWLQSRDSEQARAHWRQYLAPVEAPTPLVVDRARKGIAGGRDNHFVVFREDEARRLEAFAKANHTTVNTLVQLAWAYLLHRYSGEEHVLFGSVISGRPAEVPGIETMIGLFINTIPVRVSFGARTSVTELLAELQREFQNGQENGYLPLTEVQGCSQLPQGTSFFDSLLIFENYPLETGAAAGGGAGNPAANLRVEQMRTDERTNFKLSLVAAFRSTLTLKFSYSVTDFDRATIELLLEHLAQILRQLPAKSDIRDIDVITPGELESFARWNATATPYPDDRCIHHLFEAQAEAHPDAVALVVDGKSLTYEELNERANRVAHALIAQGVGPDTIVAIACARSFELVIGLLGILKAGGAYLPLDPSYPADRLRFMLDDSEAPVLITTSGLVDDLPIGEQRLVLIDRIGARYPETTPERSSLTPSNLAYVIYTSGSTGKPKGVLVEHLGLVNLVARDIRELEIDTTQRVQHSFSMSFDAGSEHLFNALCGGAATYLVEPASDLMSAAREARVTQLRMPVAVLEAQPPTELPELEAVLTGGEACSRRVVETWSSQARFYNQYGPTECTVTATLAELDANSEVLHMGGFIGNMHGYVVDEQLRRRPVGVPGELLIGGVGVARGYLNRPELTAERFIADPFDPTPGARVYRTGDWVRFLHDGNLEFVGRRDDQVKIRGFRIELGEIDKSLRAQRGVKDALVVARGESRNKRLAAYVIPADLAHVAQPDAFLGELRHALESKLPEQMVPADFVLLEAFPLTPNGKIDRRALPEPGERRAAATGEPMTPLQQTIAAAWCEHLKIGSVSIDDDFYDIGGDSLELMSVVADLKRRGIDVTVRQAVENRTIRELSAVLVPVEVPATSLAAEYIVRLNDVIDAPPLFVVHPFGGKIDCYKELASELRHVCTVYGVQAPFNFGHELAFDDLHQLAATYVEAIKHVQPAGPYHVAGWSGGGTVAYAIANLLTDSGDAVDYLGLFDAPPPGVLSEIHDDLEYLLISATYADPGIRAKVADVALPENIDEAIDAVAALIVEDESVSRMTRRDLAIALRFGVRFSRAHAASRSRRLAISGETTLYLASAEQRKIIPVSEVERLLASPLRALRVTGEHKHLMTGPALAEIVADLREELSRRFGFTAIQETTF
jgi:amino acid adenylation domain-containing protein/non-ribosomal peptide synthase protein (TIGR01720 family)